MVRTHRRLPAIAVALVFSCSLLACAPSGSHHSSTGPPQSAQTDQSSQAKETSVEEMILGTWFSDEQGQPHLTFSADGTFTGSDGCNNFGSTYTVNGSEITLGSYTMTARGCMGVDTWLAGVHTATVSGTTLTVKDGAGKVLGQLHKKS